MWGEILTATAQSRGAVGAVVDGYHRDTVKVLGQGFPVFSHGNYAQDSSIRTIVHDFRTPVEIGGVRVAPGDLVVGDIDGVLSSRRMSKQRSSRRRSRRRRPRTSCGHAIEGGMSATEAFARFGVL